MFAEEFAKIMSLNLSEQVFQNGLLELLSKYKSSKQLKYLQEFITRVLSNQTLLIVKLALQNEEISDACKNYIIRGHWEETLKECEKLPLGPENQHIQIDLTTETHPFDLIKAILCYDLADDFKISQKTKEQSYLLAEAEGLGLFDACRFAS